MDLDTNSFLTAVAHSCALFTTFFNRDAQVVASLPPFGAAVGMSAAGHAALSADTDASLCTVLALSLALLFAECVVLRLSPVHLQMFAWISHAIACPFLLKFAVDAHPVHHFWWLFALTNCPIALCQVAVLSLRQCRGGRDGGERTKIC
ncbi:hypothetical protein niasHT_002967 [Heterodera trifolii]|uniref:Transmembrane protein 107 n=1 Tax=Heterodera trifolii TaxID=157864 RepID=A0ABD2LP36_9BILA